MGANWLPLGHFIFSLSWGCGSSFVRSLRCHVMNNNTTIGKQAKQRIWCIFRYTMSFLSGSGGGCAGRGNGLSFSYFPAIFLPFSMYIRADIIRGSRSWRHDLKQNTCYDTLDRSYGF
ncbi:hypothetical protein HOY80DRAFT_973974 [Tuber brumale]|nr:hypothetical protein HOY80DRAFT_973974 [Tuber brumale]